MLKVRWFIVCSCIFLLAFSLRNLMTYRTFIPHSWVTPQAQELADLYLEAVVTGDKTKVVALAAQGAECKENVVTKFEQDSSLLKGTTILNRKIEIFNELSGDPSKGAILYKLKYQSPTQGDERNYTVDLLMKYTIWGKRRLC